MAGASLEDALAATAAGGNPRLLAGVAADGRRQGVPVIDLTAEEEKEAVATPRGEGVPVIDLAAPGEDEEEGQGVGGPRAGSIPVIDLTQEGSDEEGEQEVKWVGQYSSIQSILLVGDGDFSFSLALAAGFGSGANIVATSLDCYGLFVFLPRFSHSTRERGADLGTQYHETYISLLYFCSTNRVIMRY